MVIGKISKDLWPKSYKYQHFFLAMHTYSLNLVNLFLVHRIEIVLFDSIQETKLNKSMNFLSGNFNHQFNPFTTTIFGLTKLVGRPNNSASLEYLRDRIIKL